MLRIGKIYFANLYPIFYTLEQEADPAFCQFIEGVPSEVNRLLREGSIDISPSSSIEYLRRPDQYTLIDGHSISSAGPIRSILLFSTCPIEELSGKTVLASSQSETSTDLLRIVLKRFYALDTSVAVSGKDLFAGLGESSAYMLIGDDALQWQSRFKRAGHHANSGLLTDAEGKDTRVYMYDLGDIWYHKTGQPFVFALWIARRECCRSDDFTRFVGLLDRARDYAVTNLERIAHGSPYSSMLGVSGLVHYWKIISYHFNENHRRGLDLFRKYLIEENLL